jgi:thioredoxin-related protein
MKDLTWHNGKRRMKQFQGFLLAVFIVTVFSCCSTQTGFTIKVQLTGIHDGARMYLYNVSTGELIDSAVVRDGSFGFKGKLMDEPEELRIVSSIKESRFCYTDLLIGNEDIHVKGDFSDFTLNATTTGSPTQDEAQLYNKQLNKWNTRLAGLKASLLESADPFQKQQLEVKLTQLRASIENWKVNFIKDNFGTYIGMLLYNYRQDFPVDTLKTLFAAIPQKLKESKFGKAIAVQIHHPKLKQGDSYYDFDALNANGDKFKFSKNDGKYMLLQFAGTGCFGSGLSIKNMTEINSKYKDSVSFVSYFIDANKETWQATTDQEGITWPSLWTPGGKYSEVYNKYGITGTPTFFIISPDHKIISQWFGYEDGIIEKELAKAMDGH